MEMLNDLLVMPFESPQAWEEWLEGHYEQTQGIWLKIGKKASGLPSVTYAEALDSALCYGWIDGQKRSYDEQYFLQKFTPRRAKSIWSKVNVDKVATLAEAGRMKPAGLAAIAAAKADGRWDQAYDSSRTSTVPADFQEALNGHPKARDFFATLNKTNVYAVLWRVQTATTPEARRKRIDKLIMMLDEGKKFHS